MFFNLFLSFLVGILCGSFYGLLFFNKLFKFFFLDLKNKSIAQYIFNSVLNFVFLISIFVLLYFVAKINRNQKYKI